MSEKLEFVMRERHRTEKAICVREWSNDPDIDPDVGQEDIWLPLSQIEVEDHDLGQTKYRDRVLVFVPEWLALEKGLNYSPQPPARKGTDMGIKKMASFCMRQYLFASRFVADKSEARETLRHVLIYPIGDQGTDGCMIVAGDGKTLIAFYDKTGFADRVFLIEPGQPRDWALTMPTKNAARIFIERETNKNGKVKSTTIFPWIGTGEDGAANRDAARDYEAPEGDKKLLDVMMAAFVKHTITASLIPGPTFPMPADVLVKLNVPPILSPIEGGTSVDRRIHVRFFSAKEASTENPVVFTSPADQTMIGMVMPSRFRRGDKKNAYELADCFAYRAIQAFAPEGAGEPEPEGAGEPEPEAKPKKDKKKGKKGKNKK